MEDFNKLLKEMSNFINMSDIDKHKFIIDSYIEDGAQGPCEHIFGKSITDPCLGWEKTERLILDIAEKL